MATAWTKVETLRARGDVIFNISARRHADGRFSHLRAKRQHPGRLSESLGIDATGAVRPLREVQRELGEAHMARWGKVGLQTAALLHDLPPGDTRNVSVWYNGAAVAVEEVRAALDEVGTEVHVFDSPPVATVTAGADAIVELSRQPWVNRIVDGDNPGEAREPIGKALPWEPPYSTRVTNLDTINLGYGLLGDGIKVGLTDQLGPGCALRDEHEAFRRNEIVYLQETFECSEHDDCIGSCDAPRTTAGNNAWANGAACVEGRCVSRHANHVGSTIVMSQDRGEDFSAASAQLFVANVFEHTPDGPQPESETIIEAYEFFVENEVLLVNESFDATSLSVTPQDYYSDWYARHRGILFLRAAGNFGSSSRVRCRGFNGICVGGVESTGLDRYDVAQYAHDPDTRWINALFGDTAVDVEKPDVVMLSSAHAASFGVVITGSNGVNPGDPTSDQAWDSYSGTSASTPAITGMLAALAEYCDGSITARGGQPWTTRALMRLLTFRPHANLEPVDPCKGTPLEGSFPNYPTPGVGCDFHSGVGIPDALEWMYYCSGETQQENCPEEGPCHIGAVETATPTSGWMPVDEWMAGGVDYGVAASGAPPRQDLSSGVARKLTDVGPYESWMHAGTVVRAVLSYNSCPGSPMQANNLNDLGAAVNFDIALCGASTTRGPHCLMASESFDDTNEGFEVVLPEDYEWLSLYMFAPEPDSEGSDWAPCVDDAGNPVFEEPLHWFFGVR